MQRWNFIQRPGSAAVWSLTLSLLVGISHAWSQDQKVVRIGILTDAMIPWHDSTMGFRDGLKDLGYVEGKNVVFEARATRGEPSRLTRYKIGQLVDRKFLITNDILDQITY